eukprot:gene20768-64731_t
MVDDEVRRRVKVVEEGVVAASSVDASLAHNPFQLKMVVDVAGGPALARVTDGSSVHGPKWELAEAWVRDHVERRAVRYKEQLPARVGVWPAARAVAHAVVILMRERDGWSHTVGGLLDRMGSADERYVAHILRTVCREHGAAAFDRSHLRALLSCLPVRVQDVEFDPASLSWRHLSIAHVFLADVVAERWRGDATALVQHLLGAHGVGRSFRMAPPLPQAVVRGMRRTTPMAWHLLLDRGRRDGTFVEWWAEGAAARSTEREAAWDRERSRWASREWVERGEWRELGAARGTRAAAPALSALRRAYGVRGDGAWRADQLGALLGDALLGGRERWPGAVGDPDGMWSNNVLQPAAAAGVDVAPGAALPDAALWPIVHHWATDAALACFEPAEALSRVVHSCIIDDAQGPADCAASLLRQLKGEKRPEGGEAASLLRQLKGEKREKETVVVLRRRTGEGVLPWGLRLTSDTLRLLGCLQGTAAAGDDRVRGCIGMVLHS